MVRVLFALFLMVLGGSAAAWPTLSDCGWQSSAAYLVEPWEEHSVTFGNGTTRIALIDTVEPAAGAYGLVILSPPVNEFGERQCAVLHGFSGLSLEGLQSSYDPSIGLQLGFIGQVYLEDDGYFSSAEVNLIINQGTGAIDHFITPYVD